MTDLPSENLESTVLYFLYDVFLYRIMMGKNLTNGERIFYGRQIFQVPSDGISKRNNRRDSGEGEESEQICLIDQASTQFDPQFSEF